MRRDFVARETHAFHPVDGAVPLLAVIAGVYASSARRSRRVVWGSRSRRCVLAYVSLVGVGHLRDLDRYSPSAGFTASNRLLASPQRSYVATRGLTIRCPTPDTFYGAL